jgi:iron complex outermembrane receptor protein
MTEGPDALVEIAPRWEMVPSPRLTTRALVTADLAVKGSAGWYVRQPTLLELFGDRGTILGSPALRSERGSSMDLGLAWAPARLGGNVDRVLVQAAAFGTRSRDTIALISSAGYVARAENIGATQSYGGELVAAARLEHVLTLTASYTRLITEQRTIDPNLRGKAVPRAPSHVVYARAEASRRLARRLATLWLDVAAQSASYLDPANYQRVPGRALVGAGLRTEIAGGVALAATVANLADTRVVVIPPDRPIDSYTRTALADLAGFPLPGRSFYLSLEWTR